MKFTGPKFFKPFTQPVNRPVCPFTTLETTRELEPKCVPQVFLGLLLGTRQSAIGQFFSPVPSNSPISFCES